LTGGHGAGWGAVNDSGIIPNLVELVLQKDGSRSSTSGGPLPANKVALPSRIQRRVLLGLCAVALPASLVLSPSASAQDDYPSKLVRIVVPFGPGNSYDHTTRYLADQLQQLSGESFIVEAKQGAIGNIAAAHVARAPAD